MALKRKLIVGLGNPGPRYRHTRHNVGFAVIDVLAERYGVALDREKHGGQWAEARQADQRICLLKPLTYMNLSGQSVAMAARNQIDVLDDLLVIVDDVNLELGRLRIRAQGSAGGHNGLKSIISQLGTETFPRLRIGVGMNKPGMEMIDHVLGSFTPGEKEAVKEAVLRAAEAAMVFADQGVHAAANICNGPLNP